MADVNQLFTQKLLDLEQQLSYELNAFSDNVNALTEAPSQTQYDRFCGHLSYIQELLSDADRLIRSLTLDRNDPAFFKLLKTKDQIREHGIVYSRLRGSFYQSYKPEETLDQDLQRVLEPEEVLPEVEDVIPSDDTPELTDEEMQLLEQQALAEEAMQALEEKDAAKAKKKKRLAELRRQEELRRLKQLEELTREEDTLRRQQQAEYFRQIDEQEAERFREQAPLQHSESPQIMEMPETEAPSAQASDAHKQSQPSVSSEVPSDDALQYARWEEARRLGIQQDPQKAISEAQLAEERARQEEERQHMAQAMQERQAQQDQTREWFRQRQEAAENHVRLEKGHVDFSHDLYETTPDSQIAGDQQLLDTDQSKPDPPTSLAQERREAQDPAEKASVQPSTVLADQPPENAKYSDSGVSHSPTAADQTNPAVPFPSMEDHHEEIRHDVQPDTPHRAFDSDVQDKDLPRDEPSREVPPQRMDDASPQDDPFWRHRQPTPADEQHHTVVPPLSPAGEAKAPEGQTAHTADKEAPVTQQQQPYSGPHAAFVDEPHGDQPKENYAADTVPVPPHRIPTPEPAEPERHGVVPPLSPAWEQHQASSKVTHTSDKPAADPVKTPQPEKTEPSHREPISPDAPPPDWYLRQLEHRQAADTPVKNAGASSGQGFQRPGENTKSLHEQTAKTSASSDAHNAPAPQRSAFRFTPFGIREEPRPEPISQPSRSNAQIYDTIKRSMTEAGAGKPITISSAYASSMAWNVHMARIDYQGKKDTPEAISAMHHYQRQRQALQNLKADVRAGRILIEEPKAPAASAPSSEKQIKKDPSPHKTQYSFTPYGVTGSNLDEAGRVTGSFRINTKAVRDNFRYTAEQPLKVSPKYEAAFQERLDKATYALDTALKLQTKTPPKISMELNNELRLAQDAYAAFRQAKQTGAVVITGDSDKERPNFANWQLRKQANIFGSTVSSKTINLNNVRSADVEEVSPSVLRKKSKLRHEYFYNRYMRSISQKTGHYSYTASAIFSRNLYLLMQMGEDNAVRTFENGRYYTVTAAKLTYAVTHMHVVAPGKRTRQTSTIARHQFAKYADKDLKTLKSEVSDKKRLGRESKKVLKGLKAEQAQLNEKINELIQRRANLTREEGLLLKQLGARQRKINAQLEQAQQAHNALNRDLRREVAYLKFRKTSDQELRVLQDLRKKHGHFITRGTLRRDIEETQRAFQKQLSKKYDKKLLAYSDKSVKAEIKNLTKQAKALKGQIKMLQAKGSALSQAQRQALMHMMAEHKELNKKLRLFIALDKDRSLLNAELKLKSGLLNRMYKNSNAISNAMFAMQRFLLRPLREGAEYGVQGFGAGIGIITNRRVHLIMRKVFKAAIRYGPTAALTLVTGDFHTANSLVMSTNRAVKSLTAGAKLTVKRTASNTVKLAAKGSKKAVSKITPQPVKRGAHYVAKSVGGKYRTLTAFKQKLSNKFWASRVGHSLSSISTFARDTTAVISKALSIGKSIMVKAIAGFVLLFLLCGIIASLAGAPAGGAVSSVIMTPYESESGTLDLSPYQSVLNTQWTKYEQEVEGLRTEYAGTYDRVTINMPFPDDNSREILSMMAVRMYQDLDMSENPKVKTYLESIFADSHYLPNTFRPLHTTQVSEKYQCSGCKERWKHVGHNANCPENCSAVHREKEEYCPGDHQDITVNLYILFFDEIFTADSMGNAGFEAVNGAYIGDFKITHYCACMQCCGKTDGITASGAVAKPNHTIAVDTSVIPMGSHVMIDGMEYVAEDIGGAIDGNRIDIFVSSHEEALQKGTYTRPVYYAGYEGGSIVETGEWDGWTEDNIFWCKNIYSMDWTELYSGIPNVTDTMGNETNLDGVTFVDGDRPGNDAIVNTAMAELGQRGGQPYWSWYGYTSRVEWCATFVSWCANQEGVLGSSIPKFASCRYEGVPWFQSHGQWAAGGTITPVAGDIIFFDWEGDGVPNHVGIVVGTDGSKVYTIEGNSGDVVRTKSYPLNSSLIFGYGLPNY